MYRSAAMSLPMLALALICAARPAAAQDASACVDAVDRLSESFSLAGANENGSTIAQEPSARKGASLGPEQHKQITDLLRQARTAGERGDGKSCAQSLGQARAGLREARIGSAQPGSPRGAGLSTESGDGTSGGVTGGGASGGGSSSGGGG